jgi:hypothetical protein
VTATVAIAAAVLACVPSGVRAHGELNPNYLSKITGVTPSAAGLQIEVLDRNDRLDLHNRTGKTVVVFGYEGEP